MKTLVSPWLKHERLFWLLVIVALSLAGFYIYLINDLVFNTVARRQLTERLAQTQSEVAELESRYLTLAQKINLEFAYALGFRDAVKATIFVEQKTAPQQLVAVEGFGSSPQ